ncbi:uncharacterized protein V6R79_009733 [Siganus canaliculatus]
MAEDLAGTGVLMKLVNREADEVEEALGDEEAETKTSSAKKGSMKGDDLNELLMSRVCRDDRKRTVNEHERWLIWRVNHSSVIQKSCLLD